MKSILLIGSSFNKTLIHLLLKDMTKIMRIGTYRICKHNFVMDSPTGEMHDALSEYTLQMSELSVEIPLKIIKL